MGDTVTRLRVHSSRLGAVYDIKAFKEYDIDIDMETDTDQFNLVFDNPGGTFTGVISKFDKVEIQVNGVDAIIGTVDDISYNWDDSDSVVQVVGRDIASPLVDNDALPATRNNVKPHEYIKSKCNEYGVAVGTLDTGVSVTKELVIGTGESEISVMTGMIVDDNRRIWVEYDKLYMGSWNTKADPDYYFTRGVPTDKAGVPIRSLRLRDSGLDVKSEVLVYGSMDNGKQKVVGTAKNDELIAMGIRKRKVIWSANNDRSSKYANNAYRRIREDFRSGVELQMDVRTGVGYPLIRHNRTARVIDTETKISDTFFIRGVRYRKDATGGSMTTITLVPGDTLVDVLWTRISSGKKDTTKNGGVTGTPSTSLTDLLNQRR